MERSEMLISLSHDHHQALRVCQLMKRCDAENAQETHEGFVRFWGPHQNHIRIEESVLLPKFAEFGGADNPMIKRVLDEHAEIRSLGERIVADTGNHVDQMHELAGILHDHVRFEERELFPEIEAAIPEDQQKALLAALEHAETSPDWQPTREH